ncbi:Nn.00g070130.m01.CDS01 [Neocucurbitaria sp. VM-36]
MTVVHIVLFKFQSNVSAAHKSTFMRELKALKHLPCVLNNHLLVGGPSITDPIERSKGYEFALVSWHRDRQGLAAYQESAEHHRVTSEYLWPYKDDVTRFDFEVAEEDEYMCEFLVRGMMDGGSVPE